MGIYGRWIPVEFLGLFDLDPFNPVCQNGGWKSCVQKKDVFVNYHMARNGLQVLLPWKSYLNPAGMLFLTKENAIDVVGKTVICTQNKEGVLKDEEEGRLVGKIVRNASQCDRKREIGVEARLVALKPGMYLMRVKENVKSPETIELLKQFVNDEKELKLSLKTLPKVPGQVPRWISVELLPVEHGNPALMIAIFAVTEVGRGFYVYNANGFSRIIIAKEYNTSENGDVRVAYFVVGVGRDKPFAVRFRYGRSDFVEVSMNRSGEVVIRRP